MLQEIEEFPPLHHIAYHHGEAAFPEFQHAGEMYNREEACLNEAVVGAALPFPGQDDGFAPGEDGMGIVTALEIHAKVTPDRIKDVFHCLLSINFNRLI